MLPNDRLQLRLQRLRITRGVPGNRHRRVEAQHVAALLLGPEREPGNDRGAAAGGEFRKAGSGARGNSEEVDIDHAATARAADAERRVVAAFGADCTLPLAAWAREQEDGQLRLTALLATPDGLHFARGEAVGTDPAAVAAACVAVLRQQGADEVLERIRG